MLEWIGIFASFNFWRIETDSLVIALTACNASTDTRINESEKNQLKMGLSGNTWTDWFSLQNTNHEFTTPYQQRHRMKV